jgi:hypothetical protein
MASQQEGNDQARRTGVPVAIVTGGRDQQVARSGKQQVPASRQTPEKWHQDAIRWAWAGKGRSGSLAARRRRGRAWATQQLPVVEGDSQDIWFEVECPPSSFGDALSLDKTTGKFQKVLVYLS